MTDVHDNPAASRYEAIEDGVLQGFVVYRDHGQSRTLVHTETLPEFEGRGVGGALARGSLDDIRAKGLTVVPSCPFIASYIKKHEEYADLLTPRSS